MDDRARIPISSESLQVVTVDHPFRREERRLKIVEWRRGLTVSDLVKAHVPEGMRVKTFLNGREILPVDWLSAYPLPGQQLMIVPDLGGGDALKSVFRVVLMIAIMVAAWYVGGPALLGLEGTALNLFVAGVTMVGGLLVSYLIPPASTTSTPDNALDSKGYAWSPQNTEQQGVPVARWYGTNKVYGNIVSSYIDSKGDDQYLNALVCLGLGPIKRLSDFQLNDQPAKNFKNVSVKTRYGHLNQSAIGYFKNTKVEYPASVLLEYNSPYVYVTIGNDFDALEVDLSWPSGLWDGTGTNLARLSIDLEVKTRKVGSSTWINLSEPRTGYNRVFISTPRWSRGKWVDPGDDSDWSGIDTVWFEVEAGSTDPDAHYEGETSDAYTTTWRWIGSYGGEYIATGPDTETKVSVSGKQTSTKRITLTYQVPDDQHGQYEVSLKRLTAKYTPASKYGQDTYFAGVAEVLTDAFQYPRQVLVGARAKATDQLSGSLKFSCMMDGAIIQVGHGVGNDGSYNLHTDGLTTLVTTSHDGFASVTIGDEIVANGRSRRVVETINDDRVRVHEAVNWDNGGAGYPFTWRHWTFNFSNNPAWVAYDVLTQPVISGSGTTQDPYVVRRFDGIDPARIDFVKFKEWADYCDEQVSDGTGDPFDEDVSYAIDDRVRYADRIYKCIHATTAPSPGPLNATYWAITTEGLENRITFNGGFDYDTTMLEAVAKVLQVGRAAPVWSGANFTVAIDKPSDPVNLYTVGNIEESKFKETFLPLEERATEIEIDYVDGDDTWERTKLTVYRPDIAKSTGYRASLELFGVTKQSEAWRAGMYRLMCNKHLVRTVEIDLDIEAINAGIGDVVYIQHDVPQWGEGGRVVSATQSTVTIDKEVTLDPELSYKVIVRLSDDMLAERLVTGVVISNDPGTTLQVSIPFSPVPQQYDVYAFGQVDTVTRPFRVVEIKKSGDQKCTLSCLEYRPEVYQFETSAPSPRSSAQQALLSMQPKRVALSEISVQSINGIVEKGIDIDFEPTDDGRYKCSEVWYRKDGTNGQKSEWMFAGTCTGTSYQIIGVDRKTRYAVALLPVNQSDKKLFIEYGKLHYITISGVVRVADLLYSSGTNADTLEPAEAAATAGAVIGDGESVSGNLKKSDGSALVTEADLLLNNLLARTITLQPGGKFISAASPDPRIEITDTLIAGYSDATTKEFFLQASDGRAYAGGGAVVLDSTGVTIAAYVGSGLVHGGSVNDPAAISWMHNSAILCMSYGEFNGSTGYSLYHHVLTKGDAETSITFQITPGHIRSVVIDTDTVDVGGAQIKSTLAAGTAPISVVSPTLCANLNADLLDGLEAIDFFPASGGQLTGSSISRDVDDSYLNIQGGHGVSYGGSITAYGRDHATLPGNTYLGFGGYDATGILAVRHRSSSSWDNVASIDSNGNVTIGSGSTFPSGGANVFSVKSGTAPSAGFSDSFQLYSADITAGNAAPHFRTENGAIIRLYQQSHIADPTADLASLRTAVMAILTALENTRLLAAS